MTDDLTIKVLGAGSVLYSKRSWSSFVVGGTVLLDAPPGLTIALHQSGVDPLALDTVCISHVHGDHIAGLPFLLLEYDALLARTQPLTIVGPPGIQARVETLYDLYYPGFASRPRSYRLRYHEAADARTTATSAGPITARLMNHGRGSIQAFGYRLELGPYVVGYTGDTAWCEAIFDLGAHADVLIVDCAFPAGVHREHLSLDQIPQICARLPATQIILTHLSAELSIADLPNVHVPDDYQLMRIARRDSESSHDD